MSEKKLWELQIDDEFRDLIPPLQEDELSMLEASIVMNGCESPLIVWDGVIVDGHNRYAICRKHQIPFEIQARSFETRDAALLWMIRNQLGRRNLNSYQRSVLALKYEPMLAEEARKRRGQRQEKSENSPSSSDGGKTTEQLGKLAGVSDNTIRKVKKLVSDADEETKAELNSGELSVHKAYKRLMDKENADEQKVCDRCNHSKPIDEFAIPHNRMGYVCLCKSCEKEIEQAAKEAAEVASKTTAPVETYPVQGMAMRNGAPIHTGSPLPDTPEMFEHITDMVRSAARSYLMSLRAAMNRYTDGMRVEGGDDQLMEIVKHANAQAEAILSDRMKGE